MNCKEIFFYKERGGADDIKKVRINDPDSIIMHCLE